MTAKKKLPVGIEDFREFISEDFYYVDKTGFIIDLLRGWGKVNLFTRPRRFGKSLNMSMLKAFFEIGNDPALFDGLKISREDSLCCQYMGKFPVISVSLKNIGGRTFDAACNALRDVIGKTAMAFPFLAESSRLTDMQKNLYHALTEVKNGFFTMPEAALTASLQTLSMLLSRHYGQKAILLIDEYDVLLDQAFQGGYYNEMSGLIRRLFSSALKSNDSLYFAVLTGCLRVSKESIFTGLNNLKVLSVTDQRFDEYFGFTDSEVKELLAYYDLTEHYNSIREWYNGYLFGNASVYCPWDVLNYCDLLLTDPGAKPKDFWSNTSSNFIVRRLIDKADRQTKDEIECLIAGETITKEIRQELTYSELDHTIENLWSVLLTTGYLTQQGASGNNQYILAIPNTEIREIFIRQIREWFTESTVRDTAKLNQFCEAFRSADVQKIEAGLNAYLWDTISIRDTFVRKSLRENFYHGLLLGLLRHMENWLIKSNVESGEGYGDILIEIPGSRIGIVIEVKYAKNDALDDACAEALQQIEEKGYASRLLDDGMTTIRKYGIACYKKHCKVALG